MLFVCLFACFCYFSILSLVFLISILAPRPDFEIVFIFISFRDLVSVNLFVGGAPNCSTNIIRITTIVSDGSRFCFLVLFSSCSGVVEKDAQTQSGVGNTSKWSVALVGNLRVVSGLKDMWL